MSVIDDSRKVLQDFLAPELRAIAVRLEALEKRAEGLDRKLDVSVAGLDRKLDVSVAGLERKIDVSVAGLDRKIDEVDRRAEKRHDEVLAAIRQVVDYSSIQQRLARLESREASHQ